MPSTIALRKATLFLGYMFVWYLQTGNKLASILMAIVSIAFLQILSSIRIVESSDEAQDNIR